MDVSIRQTIADKVVIAPITGEALVLPAESAAYYQLVDEQEQEVFDQVLLKRKGDDLEIILEGEHVATLEDFYVVEGGSAYLIGDALMYSEYMMVEGNAAITSGVVWESTDLNNSVVVQSSEIEESIVDQSSAVEENIVEQSTEVEASVVAQSTEVEASVVAQSTEVEASVIEQSSEIEESNVVQASESAESIDWLSLSSEEGDGFLSNPLYWGGAALGTLAVAGLASGSSSSGSGDDSSDAPIVAVADSGTNDSGINAADISDGVVLLVAGYVPLADAAVDSDTVTVYWGDQIYTTTISADDLDDDGYISVIVPADIVSDAGDGDAIEVYTQINDEEQSASTYIEVDTVAPTVTITDNTTGTAISDVTYTFTFSEGVSDFSVEDLTVSGGTAAASFSSTSDDNTIYTLVVTPDANSDTNITVSVDADVAEDAVGNGNISASDSSQEVYTLVDAVSPTLTSITAGDSYIVLTFDESVKAGSGFITITSSGAVTNINVTNDQVTFDGDVVTINDLNANTSYTVVYGDGTFEDTSGNEAAGSTLITSTTLAADEAGSTLTASTTLAADEAGDETEADTSIVVFDLTSGESSDHSDQTFDASTTYSIYILVDSKSEEVSLDANEIWSGADNLGSDDAINLVGNGDNIIGNSGRRVLGSSNSTTALSYTTRRGTALTLSVNGDLTRTYKGDTSTIDLWSGSANLVQPSSAGDYYFASMPAEVLTSQGLA